MDKRLASFLKYSTLLMLLLAALAVVFASAYASFSIHVYNSILLILILASIIIAVIVAAAMLAVFFALKSGKVGPLLVIPVRMGMRLVIPFAIFVTGLLNGDKDAIRGLFIDINNIFVQSGKMSCKPDRLLLLLPHCLQNSGCVHKVTNDISNCKKCGKCTLGKIADMAGERGVQAAVVTGGTAARNLVAKYKPKMILSVACERDLALGISDVSSIPVIGVVNERPNGPCFNTTVDVSLIESKLDSLLNWRGKD